MPPPLKPASWHVLPGKSPVLPRTALRPRAVPFQIVNVDVSRPARALPRVLSSWLLLLAGCGGHKTASSKHVPPPPTITSAPPATADTANPASELRFRLRPKPIYVETGMASWYGPPYHNHKGANGEIYDQNALTAAHRTIPLNSVGARDQRNHKAHRHRSHHRSRAVRRGPHHRPVAGRRQGGGRMAAGNRNGEGGSAVGSCSDRTKADAGACKSAPSRASTSPQAERETAGPLLRPPTSSSSPGRPASGCASVRKATTSAKRRKSPARRT